MESLRKSGVCGCAVGGRGGGLGVWALYALSFRLLLRYVKEKAILKNKKRFFFTEIDHENMLQQQQQL